MSRIYISGKITGTDDYIERFGRTDLYLKTKGYEVVNPARACSALPRTLTHDEYMSICIPLLALCGTIYMLKGYKDSDGAMEELKYAQEHGMDIIFEEKE